MGEPQSGGNSGTILQSWKVRWKECFIYQDLKLYSTIPCIMVGFTVYGMFRMN